MFLLSSAYLFSEVLRVSNGLDTDQDRRFVNGTDLGSNCLQRLSADDKSRR